MKKRKNKKAQVNLLVVVLIILIALIAVGIIWNVVGSLIKKESGKIEISSLTIDLEVEEVIMFMTGSSKITVNRISGKGEISALKFVFYNEGGLTHVVTKEENLPQELGKKTYYFSPIPNFGKIKSVSVFPVIENKIAREFESKIDRVSEIPGGLVSWWRFEDTSDFIGKNNGNLIGTANMENGELVLDGGGYFSVADDSSLDMGESVTICMWIKLIDYEGDIITKGSLNKNYGVSLNSSGKIMFSYGGELDFLESHSIVLKNEWNHVVVSADWEGVHAIFINGNLDTIISQDKISSLNNNEIIIGSGFKGNIDEIMIFNRSLTRDQISSLYESQMK